MMKNVFMVRSISFLRLVILVAAVSIAPCWLGSLPAQSEESTASFTSKPSNHQRWDGYAGSIIGKVLHADAGGKWFAVNVTSSNPPLEGGAGDTVAVSLQYKSPGNPAPGQMDYIKGLKADDTATIAVSPAKNGILRLSLSPATPAKQAEVSAKPEPAKVNFDYPGRDGSAVPWRTEAEARIEQLRKGNLSIRVVGEGGRPVPGATVKVEMTRHAFPFGAAVRLPMILGPDGAPMGGGDSAPNEAGRRKFQDMLTSLFNEAGFVNDLKGDWRPGKGEPETYRQNVITGLKWFKEKGFTIRGHLLVWPDWGHSPWATKYRDRQDDAAQKEFQHEIIERAVAKAKALDGLIDEWDVVNELKNNMIAKNSFFVRSGGLPAVLEWIKEVHQAIPNTPLCVTDNSVLDSRFDKKSWKRDAAKIPADRPMHEFSKDEIEKYLTYLIKENDAPIACIGFQGHFGKEGANEGGGLTEPSEVYARLERFAKFGKPMRITEFDIDIQDRDLQGALTRDYLTIYFSHPQVKGVMFWGFWEGEMRKDDSAMFNLDWTPRPNGQAYLDLVKKKWWTKGEGASNADGIYAIRGFAGEYLVSVDAGGKTVSKAVALPVSGLTETLTLR
jgi:GH35 family endo-1,4-beta-xylanase